MSLLSASATVEGRRGLEETIATGRKHRSLPGDFFFPPAQDTRVAQSLFARAELSSTEIRLTRHKPRQREIANETRSGREESRRSMPRQPENLSPASTRTFPLSRVLSLPYRLRSLTDFFSRSLDNSRDRGCCAPCRWSECDQGNGFISLFLNKFSTLRKASHIIVLL